MTVDEYMTQFPADVQVRLQLVREIVKAIAPEAMESMSYGLIGWKLRGKPLVYVGGFAHHIGFYATPNGHEKFAADFAPYKQGKGSVQFPLNKPLPLKLIERVLAYRRDDIMMLS